MNETVLSTGTDEQTADGRFFDNLGLPTPQLLNDTHMDRRLIKCISGMRPHVIDALVALGKINDAHASLKYNDNNPGVLTDDFLLDRRGLVQDNLTVFSRETNEVSERLANEFPVCMLGKTVMGGVGYFTDRVRLFRLGQGRVIVFHSDFSITDNQYNGGMRRATEEDWRPLLNQFHFGLPLVATTLSTETL